METNAIVQPIRKVMVAMSGGVDSSVAAAILKNQGYEVYGIYLKMGEGSSSIGAMNDAKCVADQLGINLSIVDIRELFLNEVVKNFLDNYKKGLTPSPCVFCNRDVKWSILLQMRKEQGMHMIATGHYARIRYDSDGTVNLLTAVDKAKDQSYFLCFLGKEQLSHTLFPLGHYTKFEVRELARQYNLCVAERVESQDLCFLKGEDYRSFLEENAPDVVQPGRIVTRDGKVVGSHRGLAFYTIGQRKGIGLSYPTPVYVLEKKIIENELVVGLEQDLGSDQLIAKNVNWVAGSSPNEDQLFQVKIRSRSSLVKARLALIDDNRVSVQLFNPVRDITPGQIVVFYKDECLVGGGIIV